LYHGLNGLSYKQGANYCTQATFADTGIIVASFWLVAWFGGGRNWPLRLNTLLQFLLDGGSYPEENNEGGRKGFADDRPG
jgi:hypothetical protein